MQYVEHIQNTPQTEQADPRQAENNAGGFSFDLDKWKRLDRWLILGAEGGTYYVGEGKLTRDNARSIAACLDADGLRTVETIAAISEAGRAPKNDPAVFALALAASHQDNATRAAALAALPRVCRIGTHLFHFAAAVDAMRGWGRGLRRAVSRWYENKPEQDLCYQLVKYRQRDGWSHRDLFRLAHPDGGNSPIYRYVVGGRDALAERVAGDRRYPEAGELPAYLAAFDRLQHATTAREAIDLIQEHRFTHEMVPSELKTKPDVWAALLEHMPIGATIRSLGVMSANGLLVPLSKAAGMVAERLDNAERIRKARLHPLALLSAQRVYAQGHGKRGKLTWTPVPAIIDALDEAFYLAFDNVEPSGKRIMLALDVSESMTFSNIAGVPGVNPREASAALAMVTARREKNYAVLAFTCQPQYLDISPRLRLDSLIHQISQLRMGRTDCALPMLCAKADGLDVDAFQVYTDSETWCGGMHPHQALAQYRKARVADARLAVVGMVSNGFSIADPADAGQLDVVGFDTGTPAVLADFARGFGGEEKR